MPKKTIRTCENNWSFIAAYLRVVEWVKNLKSDRNHQNTQEGLGLGLELSDKSCVLNQNWRKCSRKHVQHMGIIIGLLLLIYVCWNLKPPKNSGSLPALIFSKKMTFRTHLNKQQETFNYSHKLQVSFLAFPSILAQNPLFLTELH